MKEAIFLIFPIMKPNTRLVVIAIVLLMVVGAVAFMFQHCQ